VLLHTAVSAGGKPGGKARGNGKAGRQWRQQQKSNNINHKSSYISWQMAATGGTDSAQLDGRTDQPKGVDGGYPIHRYKYVHIDNRLPQTYCVCKTLLTTTRSANRWGKVSRFSVLASPDA